MRQAPGRPTLSGMLAELLNERCHCVSSDEVRLEGALSRGASEAIGRASGDGASALFAKFPVYKLTRGKFDELLERPYLAQRIVKPSERVVRVGDEFHKLKLDVRAYVVEGRVVLLGARLYQGHTTNFRTLGGGFATVLSVPKVDALEPASNDAR